MQFLTLRCQRVPAHVNARGELNKIAQRFDQLFIKEGLTPTGTSKVRGMSAALSRAKEFGVSSVAAPSAGNAAGAMAAYGAAAGIETAVFMPADAPEISRLESYVCGARVYLSPIQMVFDALRGKSS